MQTKRLVSPISVLLSLLVIFNLMVVPVQAAAPNVMYPAYRTFHPLLTKTSGTGLLTVANLSAQAATISVVFYNSSGNVVLTIPSTIPANASKVISNLSELASGFEGSVVISANQPIASVARLTDSDGKVMLYTGVNGGTKNAYFTPFYSNDLLYIQNTGSTDTNISVTFFNPNGTSSAFTVLSQVRPGAAGKINGANLSLTPGVPYLAVVSGGLSPVYGIHIYKEGEETEILEPVQYSTTAVFSRVVKGVDEGGGARTSRFAIANPGNMNVTGTITINDRDGQPVSSANFALDPYQSTIEDLDSLKNMPEGVYSAKVTGDEPIVASQVTVYRTTSYSFDATSYKGIAYENKNHLPILSKSDLGYSIFSVMNPGSQTASVSILLYSASSTGSPVATRLVELPAGSFIRYDLRSASELSKYLNFNGYAVVYSTTAVQVQTFIDEYTIDKASSSLSIYLPAVMK